MEWNGKLQYSRESTVTKISKRKANTAKNEVIFQCKNFVGESVSSTSRERIGEKKKKHWKVEKKHHHEKKNLTCF